MELNSGGSHVAPRKASYIPMTERSPKTTADLRHTSLVGLMRPAFKESIVVHVLNHKAELPNDVRRDLDAAVNSVVKMPQFPNQPAIAPTPLLKDFIIDSLANSETTSQRGLSRLVCVSGDTVCGRQGLPSQQGYGR